MEKPRLSFWQIWNMTFGFLGIQVGWSLQLSNMSPIYQYLGAKESELPILWLAAPLTGLIVQPIIGHMSDHTWGRLGRRRPYFLVGAILSSLLLIAMPNASAIWMAAGFLWILDSSINISMEPFRAFVADNLPDSQRLQGFVMQSGFIGVGASIASALPWILSHWFSVNNQAGGGQIPGSVRIAFYLGSVAFLSAVLWTVLKSREYPPEDLAEFARMKRESAGLAKNAQEILGALRAMPETMRQLAWVQMLTWLGLFCMWQYFAVAVARGVFHAPNTGSPLYIQGVEWGGLCLSLYNAVCAVFSLGLIALAARVGRRLTHSICLLCGGVGLLSVGFVQRPEMLLLSMAGVGIAWASILSTPYAILSGSLPAGKMGVYMGVFNFFIVLPEIFNALTFGWFMEHVLHNSAVAAVMVGGGSMTLAAILMLRVKDVAETDQVTRSVTSAKAKPAVA